MTLSVDEKQAVIDFLRSFEGGGGASRENPGERFATASDNYSDTELIEIFLKYLSSAEIMLNEHKSTDDAPPFDDQ